MFCCDDAQTDVGKPENSAYPDNGYDFNRPIHGQELVDPTMSHHSGRASVFSAHETGDRLLKEMQTPKSESMSRAERLYKEEVRNMLILLEHYKLQLTLVLPKVCFVVRKAKHKGPKKLVET